MLTADGKGYGNPIGSPVDGLSQIPCAPFDPVRDDAIDSVYVRTALGATHEVRMLSERSGRTLYPSGGSPPFWIYSVIGVLSGFSWTLYSML